MGKKPVLAIVAALIGISAIAVGVYRWQGSKGAELCQVCGRDIPKQTAFRMETTHGTIMACCPRCAMHHIVHHPGLVRQAWATDLDSGHMIPAESAYYDEGGDIQYCTVHKSPVERTPMGIQMRTYDRCLPTLVAFTTQNEAEAYREKHGGRVLTYDEALEDVRQQQ